MKFDIPKTDKGKIEKRPEGYSEKQWERIVMYIDAHLPEPLKLQFLAQNPMASSPTLNRYFLKKLKIALKPYILSNRMLEGQQLLRTTGLSIPRIAGLLAYTEPDHFVRDYQKHFGYPPSEERESLSADPDAL